MVKHLNPQMDFVIKFEYVIRDDDDDDGDDDDDDDDGNVKQLSGLSKEPVACSAVDAAARTVGPKRGHNGERSQPCNVAVCSEKRAGRALLISGCAKLSGDSHHYGLV